MRSGAPKDVLKSNSGFSPAAPIRERKPPTDETRVVSTHKAGADKLGHRQDTAAIH